VNPKEDCHVSRIRKTGHGGVLKKLKMIVADYEKGIYRPPDILVIVLDHRKTQAVVADIRNLVSGHVWTVIGVAIEEVEAWWLADRQQTLGWLALSNEDAEAAGYGPDYAPEKDPDPKGTLDRLTKCSGAVEVGYGDGSVSLATDFVDAAWRQSVTLDSLRIKCPGGFAPFHDRMSERIKTVVKVA